MGTFVALVKPRYHASFITVVVAALLFAETPDLSLAVRLGVLYVSFNLLLYGGIYTFNDIADRRADAQHPVKRQRPIASGRLGLPAAAAIGASLISAGVAIAAGFLPAPILGCYVAIVALNAAYSCGGRDLPLLDIALNAAPHAVRFLMGTILVGRVAPPEHLAVWFLLAAGISCVRRLVEKEAGAEDARPVLRRYSLIGLALAADMGLAAIATFFAAGVASSPGFYAVAVPAYVIFVVSARRIPMAHVGFERLWLR